MGCLYGRARHAKGGIGMGLDRRVGRPSRAAVAAGLAWVAAGLLLPPAAVAQPPARPAGDQAPAAADLTTRYRFLERYTTTDKVGPGVIGTYRVGFRETETTTTDAPRGAPSS